MVHEATLRIRLTRGALRPRVGDTRINELRGGPEKLLGWIEAHLGLSCGHVHRASRVSEYANALDAIEDASFCRSMQTDRWATAADLLTRRDELLLGGWDESEAATLPPLVQDLARAAAGRTFVFPGVAMRVHRVISALEQGQTLPPHLCTLTDPIETWPPLWQRVLRQLNVSEAPTEKPQGPEGSALQSAQALVRGVSATQFKQDHTLRHVTTRSETAACEFTAAILASSPDSMDDTVVYCENDETALRLDACLRRLALPTTGASSLAPAHPVLQVLPLTLSLCWQPVDPQALLDFLTLPVKPIPTRVASRLARALAEEPGLGSSKWDRAIQDLCTAQNDPEGKVRAKIDEWLLCERASRGGVISSQSIRSRCNLVARWAKARALALAEDPTSATDLVNALQIVAGQASLLGELAESQGAELTEPQLIRLLDEAFSDTLETAPCIEALGGPIRVRSLAEIDAPCRRLIWLGMSTADAAASRWSTKDLQQLKDNGIELDDGSCQVSALRSAEARGFSFVQEACLAVSLPRDWEQRWHPLWLAIHTALAVGDSPRAVEDLVTTGDRTAVEPFGFQIAEHTIEPGPPPRSLWTVRPEHLGDRETVSATELQDRLGCPLKWLLTYRAKIRPSEIARLPDLHQLKGTFCHSVLERVFGAGGPLPTVPEAANLVARVFDERLPLDAAPLAQTDQLMERQRMRRELIHATQVLVGALAAGSYRIVGIEVEVASEAFGKPLIGRIDCVAARTDGAEAIVDFKYAGRNKYHDLIRDGRAVQLATYAYARSNSGASFPAVAYLVLADGLLYTPSGSPLAGNGNRIIVDGPSIHAVWDQFSTAVEVADGWLTSGEPIPARPLQSSGAWPVDATIVLDGNLSADKYQDVCRFCDYKYLCGLQEIQ